MKLANRADSPVPLLADVDTGTDDALALLYLLAHPRAELLGITTAAGNVSAGQAALNTHKILRLAQAPAIPVVQGANKPLKRSWGGVKRDFHGEDGLGNVALPLPDLPHRPETAESAAEFLVRRVAERPKELTLLFVGRLTNLAEALALDPALPAKVKQLVIMGGALRVPGNVTPYAEANIYGDPEAADAVFRAGFPLVMTGLDVTFSALLHERQRDELYRRLAERSPQIAAFVRDILRFRMNAYMQRRGVCASPLHDPLAAAVALEPWLVATEEVAVKVSVEDGEKLGATLEATGERAAGLPLASVCTGVQAEAFVSHFIDTLSLSD